MREKIMISKMYILNIESIYIYLFYYKNEEKMRKKSIRVD